MLVSYIVKSRGMINAFMKGDNWSLGQGDKVCDI